MSTQAQALNYQCQINEHDPQPVFQNREQLLCHSKQYKVSISTPYISPV